MNLPDVSLATLGAGLLLLVGLGWFVLAHHLLSKDKKKKQEAQP